MKTLLFFSILALSLSVILSFDQELFKKYEKVDFVTILSNKRMVDSYIGCITGRKPCILYASKELKSLYPEAVENHCAKCTKEQKQFLKKISGVVRTKFPKQWAELKKKLPPKAVAEMEAINSWPD